MATATASRTEGLATERDYVEPKETKTYSKTSEFWVWAATVAAVLIAALMIEDFGPDRAWSLATYASIGYMVSRGLAKAGARKSDHEGYGFRSNGDRV
jgi:hypothetical protein